jgi:hypothetical protein
VALAEIAESAKQGLLALAVGAGQQVLQTLMEESITQLVGLCQVGARGRPVS